MAVQQPPWFRAGLVGEGDCRRPQGRGAAHTRSSNDRRSAGARRAACSPSPAGAAGRAPTGRPGTASARRSRSGCSAEAEYARVREGGRVIDAGTIQSGGIVITLADIAARDAKANCKDAKGKSWGCGAAGHSALTKLIRTRAVSCVLPKGAEQKAFAARCSVAGTDLSTWLVRQGWANPKEPSEKALADAEVAAKKEKIGIWRGSQ